VSLKDTISNGKRKYTEKKNKFSSGKDRSFSKQEVSVMIANACKTAVTRALSVHRKVVSPNKKRKISFHTAQGDEALDANDLQQQVEALKLYREDSKSKTDDSSSGSSSGSES